MRELFIAYLGVVIALLMLSTGIGRSEGVDLKHILIAAFGWPFAAPVLAWKVWLAR
jgi:hypothetical protein